MEILPRLQDLKGSIDPESIGRWDKQRRRQEGKKRKQSTSLKQQLDSIMLQGIL